MKPEKQWVKFQNNFVVSQNFGLTTISQTLKGFGAVCALMGDWFSVPCDLEKISLTKFNFVKKIKMGSSGLRNKQYGDGFIEMILIWHRHSNFWWQFSSIQLHSRRSFLCYENIIFTVYSHLFHKNKMHSFQKTRK